MVMLEASTFSPHNWVRLSHSLSIFLFIVVILLSLALHSNASGADDRNCILSFWNGLPFHFYAPVPTESADSNLLSAYPRAGLYVDYVQRSCVVLGLS